jgi:hypothetical protein
MTVSCQQRKWPTLFDHLVGSGEHGRRHGKAEGPSGLEIDDQLELGGLPAEGASGARRHSGTGNFRCQDSRTDSLACRLDRRHPRVVGKTAGNG